MAKSSDEAICPACGKTRHADTERGPLAAERAYFAAWSLHSPPGSAFAPRADGMRALAKNRAPGWFWACDMCLAGKRAIAANVTVQKT